MTIKELIYTVRNYKSGGISTDDIRLSDRAIKFWINTERAFLIKQDLDKNRNIPNNVVQNLGCIPVECVDAIECCPEYASYSVGNKVARTVLLPTPISYHFTTDGSSDLYTHVGLIDGSESIELTSEPISHYASYRKYTSKLRRAFVKDRRIYITHPDGIEVINIRGIFENPEEVSKFSVCGEEKSCYDEDLDPYPITQYLVSPLLASIYTKYLQPILAANIQDAGNDASDTIKNAVG